MLKHGEMCVVVVVCLIVSKRRTSSITSSIFDLTSEADRLDQCIRDNDVLGVRKIVSVHINKFNLSLSARLRGGFAAGSRAGGEGCWMADTWSSSLGDSVSNRTRSYSYSTASGCFQAGSSYSLAPFSDVFYPGPSYYKHLHFGI